MNATGSGHLRSAPQATMGALAVTTIVVLGVATVLELLILRLGTRIAIHVPASDALESPYVAFAAGGRYAYYLSVTSLAGLLLFLGAHGLRSGESGGLLAGTGIATFALAATLLRMGSEAATLTIGLSLAGVVLTGMAAVRHCWRLAFCLAPLSLAVWLSGVLAFLQHEGAAGAVVTWLPVLNEGLVIAVAVATPAAFQVRLRGAPLVIGVVMGLLVLAAFTASPSTSRILLLWSDGLPGRFPGVVYAFAAAAYLAAVADVWRRGRTESAVALVLLLAAGVALQNTYQTGLLVGGLAILAMSPATAD